VSPSTNPVGGAVVAKKVHEVVSILEARTGGDRYACEVAIVSSSIPTARR
jgi:hypothetical protein